MTGTQRRRTTQVRQRRPLLGKGKRSSGPSGITQFQIIEVRAGREWTLYALDGGGELWCRYWIEDSYRKDRYLKGHWGLWMRIDRDVLA